MALYLTSQGNVTTVSDDSREIWYSMSSKCGYWTDDWDKLDCQTNQGIPSCPECKLVGMQTTIKKWLDNAKKYQDQGNQRYVEFLQNIKESCGNGIDLLTRYQKWLNDNETGE